MTSPNPKPVLLLAAIAVISLAGCKQDPAADAHENRCPLVPMKLIAGAKGHGSGTAVALDAKGGLSTGLAPGKTIGRFHPAGCVIGDDGVWVELTRAGKLWTLRQQLGLDGADIVMGHRRLRIQPDGEVIAIGPDGQPEPSDITSLRFEPYSPEARCCAQVMLVTYMAMMPSMAVADGVAETLPPPKDSVCKGLPGP